MRLTKKTFAILSSMILLSSSSYAITLSDALINTYKNNEKLQKQREELKKTDESATQALAKFLPNISLESTIAKAEIKTIQPTPVTPVWTRASTRTNSAIIKQNIFKGGGDLIGMKLADEAIKAGRAQLQSIEQEVLLEAIQAYMGVVSSKELFNLSKQSVAVLAKHLKSNEEKFTLGENTRAEVATSKAALANAKTKTIEAEGNYKNALASFEQVIGLPVDNVYVPDEITNYPKTLDDTLKQAVIQHPAIITHTHNVAAKEKAVSIAKTDLLPVASLQGTMSRKYDGFKKIAADGRAYDTNSNEIALKVTVPIFQSGSEYSKIRESKSDLQKTKYEQRAAHKTVTQNAIQAWQSLETSTAQIASSLEAVEAAQIALDGMIQEEEVGTKTNLEVLDAERKLFENKVNLVQAKNNRMTSQYALKAAVGELNATSLSLATQIYDPTENYRNVRFKIVGF
jgi:TolC family type I secretion outer membrane protein